jgi:transglutaminase-like putative cysteine protease
MESVLRLLLQRINLARLLAWLILAVSLTGVVTGIATRIRDLDLVLLLTATWLAMFVGLALGAAPLRFWQTLLITFLAGAIVDLIQVGQLIEQILNTFWELARYSFSLWQWRIVPFIPANAALLDLLTRTNTLLVRLRDWLSAIFNGQPAFDPVAVALAWVFVAWLVAVWAGWWLQRGRPLHALLPALLGVAAILAYSGGQTLYLLVPLGGLLLLMILSTQHRREIHWESTQVDFSEGIRFDLTAAGIILTLTLLVMAGGIPNLSLQFLADQVRSLSSRNTASVNPIPDSLGLQVAPAGSFAFDSLRSPGLPQQHLIGSGPELSQRVVMTIGTDDPSLRYYWRSTVYNQYTGHGWLTTTTEETEYRANVRLVNTALPGQNLVHLDVSPVESLGGIVYEAGTLVTVNSDFTVAYRTNQDMFSATSTDSYQVESLVADPNAAQLRTSLGVYPDYIRFRYLALPDSIPQRVLSLARDLTATAPTPYDRAKAIEAYLRTYPYTLDLPAPPPGRDIVDYFLFDLKRGYCDYYASSMVVLARAAGLPARLVSGYAQGTLDPQTKRYIVTEADAHSWVEIYFDGYGWVEFEPTGGRPTLERSTDPKPTLEATSTLPPSSTLTPRPTLAWFPIAWAIVFLTTLSLIAWQVIDWLRLRSLKPAQTNILLYKRLIQQARRLAISHSEGDTPYEFAQALLFVLAQRRVSAPIQAKVKRLIDLYVYAIYSQRSVTTAQQQEAIQLWGAVRWELWWAKFRLIRPSLKRSN